MWSEHWVRSRMPKLAGFKLYVPVMMTPQGIPVFTSPYLFAVAYDANKGGGSSNGAQTSATVSSFTIASGAMLLVGICNFNPKTVDASSVNWNTSEALASVITPRAAANGTRLNVYGITAPTSGTHDITTTFSSNNGWGINAMSLTGMDTTAPVQATQSGEDSGAVSSFSLSITTTVAGSLIVDFTFRNGPELDTATQSGQTMRLDYSYTNGDGTAFQLPMSTTTAASTGSHPVGYSWPTNTRNWTCMLLEIQPLTSTTYNQDVFATTTLAASMLTPKTILQALTASTTGTASIAMIKNFVRTLSATATATASVLKGLSQALTATTTITTSIEASRAYLQALTATLMATASLTKVNVWARTLSAAVTGTATIAKIVSANIAMTATATITATVEATRGVLMTAAVATTAIITTAIGKTLVASVSILAKVSAPFWRTKYPAHGDGEDYEIKYPHE